MEESRRDRRAGRGELESLDNPDGEEQAADPAGPEHLTAVRSVDFRRALARSLEY
jgi:hypothetical protein